MKDEVEDVRHGFYILTDVGIVIREHFIRPIQCFFKFSRSEINILDAVLQNDLKLAVDLSGEFVQEFFCFFRDRNSFFKSARADKNIHFKNRCEDETAKLYIFGSPGSK